MIQRKHDIDILAHCCLYQLYDHAVNKGGRLSNDEIARLFSTPITSTFARSAIAELSEAQFVDNINGRYEINTRGIRFVQKQLSDPDSFIAQYYEIGGAWLEDARDQAQKNEAELPSGSEMQVDAWSPLPIDRETTEFDQAVKSLEKAVSEIENNNGYAASETDERNNVVWTLRVGLDSLRQGFPSSNQIRSWIVQPLKFISEKFTAAAMGEAAKVALKAVLNLFGWDS